jgi:hypothetical protein
MRMLWALESSVGDDFGLAALWGLENTFYYAFQMEYKSTVNENNPIGIDYWNYHESAAGTLNTETFFYAAQILGDDVLGALRVDQLNNKIATIWDVLAYDAKYLDVDVYPLASVWYLCGVCPIWFRCNICSLNTVNLM